MVASFIEDMASRVVTSAGKERRSLTSAVRAVFTRQVRLREFDQEMATVRQKIVKLLFLDYVSNIPRDGKIQGQVTFQLSTDSEEAEKRMFKLFSLKYEGLKNSQIDAMQRIVNGIDRSLVVSYSIVYSDAVHGDENAAGQAPDHVVFTLAARKPIKQP